ncbi:hypothetical protein [Chryseobacterium sp. JM1]|uniref:hypothetical protein n=1 Tax=Chryseobacterium sp. JM1 TaxID=1233950 RepID=UPI0004E6EF86|nr:hypothetical protein [Chryseobacterium sp. JM1]KFF19267.1 hypothetical protein IW22_16515 [Chryseobacterium sp. JM1]
MKKNLSIRLFLNAAVVACLISCRSEDLLNSSEEQPPSKFRVFTAQEKETVNYAKGFKTLLERYDEINNVQHTAKALKKAFKNSSEMADEYVELNIRSQDFVTKTNEKFTLFPLMRNRKVDGIIIAMLKENDTQVEFLKMDTEAENYNTMLDMFKEAYLKNTLQQRIAAKANGNCSSDGSPCDTGEVVITMPGTGGTLPGGIWNGGPPPGGCQPYDNCLNPEGPGGTGGGEGNGPGDGPNTAANPCEQTKKVITNATSKPAIDDLKTKSTQGGEDGYKIKADGTPSNVIHGSAHSVKFGDKTGYAGGYHNHTPTGIPMLSPPDVDQLLGFARAQPTSSDNTGDAFMGMVAPNGMHYVIWFNGTYQDALTNFSQEDLNAYTKWYQRQEAELSDKEISGTAYIDGNGQINSAGVEKLFFNTLKKMGLEGKVILKRVESDGTISSINLNSNNQPIASPC